MLDNFEKIENFFQTNFNEVASQKWTKEVTKN